MNSDGIAEIESALPDPLRVKVHRKEHLFVEDDTGARCAPPWLPGTIVSSNFEREGPPPWTLGVIVCVDGDLYHVLWSEDAQ